MLEITKQAIKKLLYETKRVLVVEDFDLVEELDKIANTIACVSPNERRLLSSPYELCGINF